MKKGTDVSSIKYQNNLSSTTCFSLVSLDEQFKANASHFVLNCHIFFVKAQRAKASEILKDAICPLNIRGNTKSTFFLGKKLRKNLLLRSKFLIFAPDIT